MASPQVANPSESVGKPKLTWDLVERALKLGTGVIAVIYAAGFLVVSVHHGKFGIVMFEFLRARVFAAGILFAIFLVIPIMAASRLFGLYGLQTGGKTRYVKAENLKFARLHSVAQLGLQALFLSTAAQAIFVSQVGIPAAPTRQVFVWFVVFAISTAPIYFMPDKWFDTHPKTVAVISLVALLIFFFALSKSGPPQFTEVTYWFFGVGLGFLVVRWIGARDSERMRRMNWEGWVFTLLSLTLIFTTTIYGRVKPAWGGGALSPVTLHFAHPTAFSSTNDVTAFLIDETEKGFYLTHKVDDHKGAFIPREAVASLDYEELK